MSVLATSGDRLGTAHFLWRLVWYRPVIYVVENLLWIGVYNSRLLPGLVAQRAFDALQEGHSDTPAILWLAALFVGAGAVEAVLQTVGWVIDVTFRTNVSALLQRNMLSEVLRRPGARALDRTPGEAQSVFRDDVQHAENGADWTIDMIGNLIFATLAMAILIRVNATIAIFVFVPLALIVLLTQLAATQIRSSRAASQQAMSRVTGALGEIFGAVQAVQIARAEKGVVAHFRRLSEIRRRSVLRERGVILVMQSIYWNTVYLGTGLILLLGAQAMRDGSFTVGDFALFVSYLGFVTEFTAIAGVFLSQYKQVPVSVARMLGLMRGRSSGVSALALVAYSPFAESGPLPHAAPPTVAIEPLRSLQVSQLTCRHASGAPNGRAPGIHGASFRLERGSFTVVTGRIGAGKTTLLRALLGLLPAEEGEVRWNGVRVDDRATFFIPPRSAYVPQLPRLFGGTLRENLLLGMTVDDARIAAAVREAVLELDVAQLERGLDTIVGSRGVRLSGGQVQRAAAARAFVRDAELLIVDDLSSALDVETERLLWERLMGERRGSDAPRTILAVSHRRPVLRRADWIIVLKHGRVESQERLEQLLHESEELRQLWQDESTLRRS